MKLDATDLRYVTSDEFRVLTAVEMGSKNHEVVPTALIAQISGLRNGGTNKLIGSLAKRNLVSKVQNSKYDGYRLTYGGYDYLAMRAMSKRDSMHSVGNQIGVGKESDIYIVADAKGKEMVLKLHRLGRISFRAIKDKRDYLGKRKSASWMYMSRLAAQKEWAFMKVLHEHGFPVPQPIDQARHCILMEFIDAYPLRQISEVPSPGKLYSTLMDLIVRFALAGLIHGDYNEFNILIRRNSGEPIVIDFPQMVSTSHENAEWYFNRDVECIRTFFKRRFQYESSLYPRFRKIMAEGHSEGGNFKLDVIVAASGFGRKDMKILEQYMETIKQEAQNSDGDSGTGSEEEEEGDDGDENVDCNTDRMGTVTEQPSDLSLPRLGSDQKSNPYTPCVELGIDGNQETVQSVTISAQRVLTPPPPTSVSLEKIASEISLNEVKEIISSDLMKARAKQYRKYHSKRGARNIGRPQGSKAKQDMRVKVDQNGVWD